MSKNEGRGFGVTDRLENQRILLTGGTGFIGTALASRLCDDNEIILFDRRVEGSPFAASGLDGHPNVTVFVGDILDEGDVAKAVDCVDSVVHLAALVGVNAVRSQPRETIETNILGTHTLLKALEPVRGLNRLVFFSTSEVFGINSFRVSELTSASIGPVQEARWAYSISKLASEHLVQCYYRDGTLPTVTIRPFNVFGPGRSGDHAMLRFIMAAIRDEELVVHGVGDQIRSWCYIDDFIDGLIATLIRPEAIGEDFNLGNPRNTHTIYELAQRVIRLTNSRSEIRFEKPNYSDVDIRVPRLDKARRLLDFDPRVDLDEGVRRTAAWCRENEELVRVALEGAPPAPASVVA